MKSNKNFTILLPIIIFLGLFISCSPKNENAATPETKCFPDVTFSGINDDVLLGAKIDSQIVASSAEFPLLDPSRYTKAYGHLERITNNIKNSGKIAYIDQLAWKVRIIKNDEVLNAFCTPGGYIYVYTGIIKYLDSEDDFAGVMGHEIAHADLRHSAKSMTQEYGVSTLLQIISGKNPSMLATIVTNLSKLKYSRCHETQADENSVGYLSATSYKCNGAAGFFQKISAAGGSSTPEFLSTHPDPGNRVENINNRAKNLGCNTSSSNPTAQYEDFKRSLDLL
ncbi:MAG: peptidase M48 [Cytophagales bacterium]|nr:MAG: peptidase M48 [Cytophagales bacterium]